jgi:tetratricopeptide (TPR) repeat protein
VVYKSMFWAISIGIGAALMQIAPAMALEPVDLKPEELTAIRDRVREVDEVVRKNPSDPINYNNRAILKQQLGDVAGALADYNRAIELAPNFASAYSNRAYVKFTKFLLTKDALADYNRAISIDPRHARAYANRAMLKYNSLKDSSGAISDIQQAAKFYQAEGNEELAKVALNYANIWEAASINTSKTTVTVATNTPNIAPSVQTPPKIISSVATQPQPSKSTSAVKPRSTGKSRTVARKPKPQKVLTPVVNPPEVPKVLTPVVSNPEVPKVLTPVVNPPELAASNGSLPKIETPAVNIAQPEITTIVPPSTVVPTPRPSLSATAQFYKQEAVAAYQRGWEKYSKGNRKGAIIEYNTAIFLDANYADAYYNRGLIRKATGFKKAAIADLVTAANIYRQQQQQANFQEAMSIVRELKGEFTPRPKN